MGKWEVLWLRSQHPFHPRNRSQTAYCTLEFIGALKDAPRILRFRLRLMRYNYQVQYVPGKHQVTARTLSRAPVALPGLEDKLLVEEVEAFSTRTTSCLPATPNRLQQIRDAQKTDEECSLLRSYCLQGWPPYMPHQPLLRPYCEKRKPPHDYWWPTSVWWSYTNSKEYATTNPRLHSYWSPRSD